MFFPLSQYNKADKTTWILSTVLTVWGTMHPTLGHTLFIQFWGHTVKAKAKLQTNSHFTY